jgi:hypothetical protein
MTFYDKYGICKSIKMKKRLVTGWAKGVRGLDELLLIGERFLFQGYKNVANCLVPAQLGYTKNPRIAHLNMVKCIVYEQ